MTVKKIFHYYKKKGKYFRPNSFFKKQKCVLLIVPHDMFAKFHQDQLRTLICLRNKYVWIKWNNSSNVNNFMVGLYLSMLSCTIKKIITHFYFPMPHPPLLFQCNSFINFLFSIYLIKGNSSQYKTNDYTHKIVKF